MVAATTFVNGAHGTLIIRMDKDGRVTSAAGLQEVDRKLDCERLKPTNIAARDLPAVEQTEGSPVAAYEDANAPGR